MAGHAQLKFVMTECSKTQIRLTGLNWYMLSQSQQCHANIAYDVISRSFLKQNIYSVAKVPSSVSVPDEKSPDDSVNEPRKLNDQNLSPDSHLINPL